MICGLRRRRGKTREVEAYTPDIACPLRNLDSIVLLSAEVSEFDKMPHRLSPVSAPTDGK